jgi:CRP-like cAMP-binding protein
MVSFKPGEFIYHSDERIDQCYFPLNGMVSLLSANSDGRMIEAGYIGYEGLVGSPILFKRSSMPYHAIAQSHVQCHMVSAQQITKIFDEDLQFRTASLHFMHVLTKQFVQTCVCNHFHSVESRACRWLSAIAERSGNVRILLTQEFLAMILGVRRASISEVHATLRDEGLIRYNRGRIEIVDLDSMRERACECYQIIRSEHELLNTHLGSLCGNK